jgi:hypothetical protein
MVTDNSNEQFASLKNQVFTLLVALIVVSGTLTAVLYQQASQATKDINQGEKAIASITQTESKMADFAHKLLAYGDKHPDFKALLAKDGITAATIAPAPPKK